MNIYDIIEKEKVRDTAELARGYVRYEALRKLNPREFAELNRRNLAGERFDDLVDELALKARDP